MRKSNKVFPVILVAILFFAANLAFSQSESLNPNGIPIKTVTDLGLNCSGGQIHDDGVAENGYGWNASAGNPSGWNQKFIPTVYPYKFSKFCASLTRLATGVANWTFRITMWKSVNGLPGVIMDSITVTATAIPVWPSLAFYDFVLPSTWASVTGTDSVYIGIMTNPITMTGVFVGSDESASTPIWPGYGTVAAGPWTPLATTWATYRALLFRTEGGAAAPPVTRVWTEQTSGITASLYSVSAVSNDVAWACGATGKVLRTTNKGLTWTNVSGNIPATTPLYNIFAWDANLAICTGSPASGSFIYKTSNGGVNWITALTTTGGFDDNLWMTSATNAYCIGDAVGGNWHLVQSTNGGDNWSAWGAPIPTTNANGTYNNAAWFQGTQIWWSPVGESKMKYSSNMGTSWVDQTLPLANITATCFNSPTSGLAGGSSASTGVLRTTDAGTTWTVVPQTFVGTSSISGIAGTGSEYWVSLQATTIHYSSNNGTNWSLAYTAAAGSFYHLAESRTGNTIWGVRSNGAITRYGDPPSGVTPIGTTVPDNFSLGQNYPNPFNPTTNIKFAVPQSGLVTIKVYDLLGKEITTLVNEVKNPGSYVVDFNASTLASGVYFYKMEVNGFREVKRMTLIK